MWHGALGWTCWRGDHKMVSHSPHGQPNRKNMRWRKGRHGNPAWCPLSFPQELAENLLWKSLRGGVRTRYTHINFPDSRGVVQRPPSVSVSNARGPPDRNDELHCAKLWPFVTLQAHLQTQSSVNVMQCVLILVLRHCLKNKLCCAHVGWSIKPWGKITPLSTVGWPPGNKSGNGFGNVFYCWPCRR